MRSLLLAILLVGCGSGIHASSAFEATTAEPRPPTRDVGIVGTPPRRAHKVLGRVRVSTEATQSLEPAMDSAIAELRRRGRAEGCDALQIVASPRTFTCDAEPLIYDALCIRWSEP